MPLFGANGGLDSTSPDTFNPLKAQILLDMKIVTTLFYTQSSTVWREATVTQTRLLDVPERRAAPHRPFSIPSAFNNVEFRSADPRSAGALTYHPASSARPAFSSLRVSAALPLYFDSARSGHLA